MAECPKCKEYHGKDANFCSKCGTPVSLVKCQSCSYLNARGASFCSNCGVRSELDCRSEVRRTCKSTKLVKNDHLVIIPNHIDRDAVAAGLQIVDFPENMTRKIVKEGAVYYGFPQGLVRNYMESKLCFSKQWRGGNRLVRLVSAYVKQQYPSFNFTTIYFNKNLEAELHIDKHNAGETLFLEFGNYDGGGLWIQDEAGEDVRTAGRKISGSFGEIAPGQQLRGRVFHGECQFRGDCPHMTASSVTGGDRYSLVLYCVQGAECIDASTHKKLMDWGFNPPPRSMQNDEECAASEDYSEDERGRPQPESLPIPQAQNSLLVDLIIQNLQGVAKQVQFDGRVALIKGLCQMGKSAEIALAAFLTHFKHNALPIVFVKNVGGTEAAQQLCGNIATFNKHLDSMFAQHSWEELYGRRSREFHLVPKLRGEYLHNSLDAQVPILLANASNIPYVKNEIVSKLSCSDGKARMTLVFDEDDLNTTSSSRDHGALEKQLFEAYDGGPSLRDRAMQVISVTATVGAVALAEKQPLQIHIMPVKSDYWGLSELVPKARQPIWKEIAPEDLQMKSGDQLPIGVSTMMKDMFNSGVSCTGLLHLETRVGGHKKMQARLVEEFESERLLVLTHNGGQDYVTRKSSEAKDLKGGWSDYGVESHFPLTARATKTLQGSFLSFLETFMKASERYSEDGLCRFSKSYKIMDVLTVCQKFRESEASKGHGLVTVAILSGHAGGRGTTFRDSSHQSCLTDLYLSKDSSLSAEHLVQVANRISGIFRDEKGAPLIPHRLNWWTSTDVKDSVMSGMKRLNALTESLRNSDGKSLQQIVRDCPDFELPPKSGTRQGRPKLARPKVEQEFCEKIYRMGDPGRLKELHGGGDATELLLTELRKWQNAAPSAIGDAELLLCSPEEHIVRILVAHAFGEEHQQATLVLFDSIMTFTFNELQEVEELLKKANETDDSERSMVAKAVRDAVGRRRGQQVKTAECIRSAERHGRSATILRDSFSSRDYCDIVFQIDSALFRVVVIVRNMGFEDFLHCRQAQGTILAWHAFVEAESYAGLSYVLAQICAQPRCRFRFKSPKKRSIKACSEEQGKKVRKRRAWKTGVLTIEQHAAKSHAFPMLLQSSSASSQPSVIEVSEDGD